MDEIVEMVRKTRKWVELHSTSQDIELLTAGRMRIVSLKSTIGEMLAECCRQSAKAEKERRMIEDVDRYRELMESDVASRAEVVAKHNSAAKRAEEILAIGEEKALRVLWSDMGDILDALSQKIAALRSEWSERNRQTT